MPRLYIFRKWEQKNNLPEESSKNGSSESKNPRNIFDEY